MTQYGARTIRHEGAGGQIIRYAGVWRTDDGTLEYCPHDVHRTVMAAARCAQRADRLAAPAPVLDPEEVTSRG